MYVADAAPLIVAQSELPLGELAHCQVMLEMLSSGSVRVAVTRVSTQGCVDDSATVPALSGEGVAAPLKTQGRACLIARMSSLVILNSISMANGSSGAGLYSPSKWSWIVVRCCARCPIWASLMSSSPRPTRLEVDRTR